MKIIGFMNGWAIAPHCWRNYLFLKPIRFDRATEWHSISIFGFAVFFEN